jgi:hypothetical protein
VQASYLAAERFLPKMAPANSVCAPLPPSPPAEKANAREDQTGQSGANDWARGQNRSKREGPLQRPQAHREIRPQGKHDEMEGTA